MSFCAIPAKPIGYPSQNKKRSNSTHKANASCFTFYFAPTHNDQFPNFEAMDKLTKEQRRKNMQAVKATGSKIETTLAKALFALGHRYRKNDKNVFGKPDITMKRYKLAIFVDSEFFHGKNWSKRKHDHKSNAEYWHKKIEGNIQRDKEVNHKLKKEGWKVLRFWGKTITTILRTCTTKIEQTINEIKRENNS